MRVVVVEARPQLGGRATAFNDRESGELVDNGQHVLFGCYRETFAFLRRIGADENVRLQASLAVPFVDAVGRRSELRCPPLPSPLHLLAAVLDWDAMPWSERLSALRLARPLRAARRELDATGRVTTSPATLTVSEWLRAASAGRPASELALGTAGCCCLEPATRSCFRAPFVRVLAEMFGRDASAAAIGLPLKPLHQMYAEPARAFIEANKGIVRTNALARVVIDGDSVAGVDIRGESIACERVVAAVPWFAVRTSLDRSRRRC